MAVQLSVEQLNGQTLSIEVVPDMTVKQVKKEIKSVSVWEEGVIRETILAELFLAGQQLKDENTVVDLGLSAESSLSVIFRPNLVRCSNKGSMLWTDADPEALVVVEVPESETRIENGAFLNCESVAEVTMPDSVTSIGERAFHGCKNLRRVAIPGSVTQIGNSAFYNCRSLSSVTIPDFVSSIEAYAFCGCTSLTHVVIPNSLTRIEGFTFHNCSSLTDLTIPDTVRDISDYAFCGCTSLTPLRVVAPARFHIGTVTKENFWEHVIKKCACGTCKPEWFAKAWICPVDYVRQGL